MHTAAPHRRPAAHPLLALLAYAAIGVAALTLATQARAETFSAGFSVNEDASAEETGLPVYPGATPVKKRKGGSDSADVRMNFGEYGLKVVAARLESEDSPERVAAFYRDALTRYGSVLDCGNPAEARASRERAREDKKALRCDRDKPRRGGMLFKAGTKHDQRVVEITPTGGGSEFSLVSVVIRQP